VRIWLINPYGPLPGEGWRDYRFTLIARALSARGHDVTWWTANFSHQTKRYRSEAPAAEFKIELVPTPAYKSNIGLGRLWFEFQFARGVIARSRAVARPDIIIAADPPQFCGWAGRRLAVTFDVPLILDCLDLWPELFINISPSLLRPLIRLAVQPLFALRRRNVRAATLTITVADEYSRVIEGQGAARVITIPIGVDLSQFPEAEKKTRDGRLTAVYAGSLGEAYDLTTVLKTFEMLQRDGVAADLVVAGQGPLEGSFRGVENVRFVGALYPTALNELYRNADLGLASYSRGSTVATPVKVFDYLAAGLPIVTSLPNDFGNAAIHYDAGNPESLLEALLFLAANRDQLRQMSRAALALRNQFDSRFIYQRYADEIEAVARR
jgi:glycosyltransferase involved in cell wall biosynthesis